MGKFNIIINIKNIIICVVNIVIFIIINVIDIKNIIIFIIINNINIIINKFVKNIINCKTLRNTLYKYKIMVSIIIIVQLNKEEEESRQPIQKEKRDLET